jgi:hypothetical protein
MPVNVNVGFSRKVGEPNYGSRGASVQLELEIDRVTLDDPARLQTEIEAIFERVHRAVEQQLERPATPPSEGDGARVAPPSQAPTNGHRPGPRPATPNQVRAMEMIARDRGVDLVHLLHTKFDGRQADELSTVEASVFIDFLKSLSPE